MAALRVQDLGFLNGISSSRSFRDAFSGLSPAASAFPDLKISTHQGLPSLWISEVEILALVAQFETLSRCLSKNFVNLKLIGDFSITVLNSKHVLIKLVNELDYRSVCPSFLFCEQLLYEIVQIDSEF
ncbi:hypothetical protein MA16_Dca011589 [Dendrobium catenatum]|uniref:Uncharacterized protein n=1 Tax=Dendrobium catenatum TaxID=906689 RepID=A0A2I0WQP0_9ASPA|nr:hypothetical protein MA16_Dca011589 [Dendrobium catenatum]